MADTLSDHALTRPGAPVDAAPAGAAEDRVHATVWRQALALRGDHWAIKDLASGRYLAVDAGLVALLAAVARGPAARPSVSLVGHVDADWFDSATAVALRAADQAAAASPHGLESDHHIATADGQRRAWRVVRVPFRDGALHGLLVLWQDVTDAQSAQTRLAAALGQIEQQQQAQARLQREVAERATHDPVSGLHNRGSFDEQLRRELDLSTREHREFALVTIEVELPEGASAEAVERVLQTLGRLLKGGTRAMDASARLEGQRFCVLLSGVGLATAHARMETLRRQCATQIVALDGQEVRFSVSMGVASFPHTAGDREQLLAASEAALQEAHRRGGNQVTLASIRLDNP